MTHRVTPPTSETRAAFKVLKYFRTGCSWFSISTGKRTAAARKALQKNNFPKPIAAKATPSLMEGLVRVRGDVCLQKGAMILGSSNTQERDTKWT